MAGRYLPLDIRERQVFLVSMNIFAQQAAAWISVLVWKTVEAPRFLQGYPFTAAAGLSLSLWAFVVLWYARANGIVLYNSLVDPEYASKIESDSKSQRSEKEDQIVVKTGNVVNFID